MATKCYAVTNGCYSDYRVHAVFQSEKQARAFVKKYPRADYGDDLEIEPMPFIGEGEPIPKRLNLYSGSVELWDSAPVGEIRINEREVFDFEQEAIPRPRLRYVRAPCHNGKGGRLESYCTDRNAVVKSLADRVAMFNAGAWRPKAMELNWDE